MSQRFISSVCFQSFAVCESGCMSVLFDRDLPSLSVSVCVIWWGLAFFFVSICAFCLFQSVLFDEVLPSSLSVSVCAFWQGFALSFVCFNMCHLTGFCLLLCLFRSVLSMFGILLCLFQSVLFVCFILCYLTGYGLLLCLFWSVSFDRALPWSFVCFQSVFHCSVCGVIPQVSRSARRILQKCFSSLALLSGVKEARCLEGEEFLHGCARLLQVTTVFLWERYSWKWLWIIFLFSLFPWNLHSKVTDYMQRR